MCVNKGETEQGRKGERGRERERERERERGRGRERKREHIMHIDHSYKYQ